MRTRENVSYVCGCWKSLITLWSRNLFSFVLDGVGLIIQGQKQFCVVRRYSGSPLTTTDAKYWCHIGHIPLSIVNKGPKSLKAQGRNSLKRWTRCKTTKQIGRVFLKAESNKIVRTGGKNSGHGRRCVSLCLILMKKRRIPNPSPYIKYVSLCNSGRAQAKIVKLFDSYNRAKFGSFMLTCTFVLPFCSKCTPPLPGIFKRSKGLG